MPLQGHARDGRSIWDCPSFSVRAANRIPAYANAGTPEPVLKPVLLPDTFF